MAVISQGINAGDPTVCGSSFVCMHAYKQASKLATQDGKEEVRTYYGIALLQSLHWEI
jgi:hypothetical protein